MHQRPLDHWVLHLAIVSDGTGVFVPHPLVRSCVVSSRPRVLGDREGHQEGLT